MGRKRSAEEAMIPIGTRVDPAVVKKLDALAESIAFDGRVGKRSELLRAMIMISIEDAERRVAQGLTPVPVRPTERGRGQ